MLQLLDRLMRRAAALRAKISDSLPIKRRFSDPAMKDVQRLIAEGNREEAAGNLESACALYRRAALAAPQYANAHLNLGIGLAESGDVEGAIRSYERVLEIDAGEPYANYNLARALYLRGALDKAEKHFRIGLASKPDFPEARIALSNLLDAGGRTQLALEELDAALRARPDDFGALYNQGVVLIRLGRTADAEKALRRSVALAPEGDARAIEARLALAGLCVAREDHLSATAELEVFLARRPDRADVLHQYGTLLVKQWRLVEAELALRQAVTLDPSLLAAYRELARICQMRADIDGALAIYREARERNPKPSPAQQMEFLVLCSAELFVRNFSESVPPEVLLEEHRAAGSRIEQAYPPRFRHSRTGLDPGRRLRVGYVSGDLCDHPVGFFMVPLLEHHDRSGYEIHCYSLGSQVDETSRALAKTADFWRDGAAMSWLELADAIHEDRIDILIDLSGHSGVTALAAFAQEPALVQATWLGYMNTTGLTRIRYRICDGDTDPVGSAERLHTETLVRLPHSQWVYRPHRVLNQAAEPPSRRNGFVTFGSFNQFSKLSSSGRRLWAEILARVPGSRLVVGRVPDDTARERFAVELERAGVAADRITFSPNVPHDRYYQQYDEVDVVLDPMPYSGCTTTFDTLWMGVPVVTLPGRTSVSRATASILSTLGAAEWIADTPERYVSIAVELAGSAKQLAESRLRLRERMLASPLMDERRFARDMEEAYRRMWLSACA